LEKFFGKKIYGHYSSSKRRSAIFQDDYPDTTWGDSGSILTPKKIKEAFEAFKQINLDDQQTNRIG